MKKEKPVNEINKTISLKITTPIYPTTDWKEFIEIIRMLQAEVHEASNRVITKCNIYYGKYYDNEIDISDHDTQNSIRNDLYSIAKSCCKYLSARNMNSISNTIYSKYFCGKNSYVKMIQKGEGNPPMNFKSKIPIPVYPNGKTSEIKIIRKGRCDSEDEINYNDVWYDIQLPIISKSFKDYWNENKLSSENNVRITYTPFKIGILARKRDIKRFCEAVLSGEYKITNGQIVEKKDKNDKPVFYLNLSYKYTAELENIELNPKKICGIDLGEVKPITCVNNLDDEFYYVRDNTVIKQKEEMYRKLSDEQSKAKYDGRSGHGRKVKLKDIKYRRNKIKNFTEHKCHMWVNDVFNMYILPKGCGTIHLEKLTGLYANNSRKRFMKHFPYYLIQEFIKQKAKEYGIKVEYVDSRYTSQKCSKCGYTNKNNRPKDKMGQGYFKCLECGHGENADVNAAKNIAKAKPLSQKQLDAA